MNQFGIAIAGIVVAAAFLASGCSSGLVDQGGDTTCGEFKSHDDRRQERDVSTMLKEQDGEEPTNLEITARRVAVEIYCETVGKDSDKIKDAS